MMKRLILLLMLAGSACQWSGVRPTPSPTVAPPTSEVTASPASTGSSPTPTLTPSVTPAPYEPYTIDSLRGRTYGGGNIEIAEIMEDNDLFTRYLIRYPSDGLNIYGFANVPKGSGPFPLIIGIHGFVDPASYETLDYTTEAIDIITQYGYIVIHPNLRGYPPSDKGDNLFRVGMAVDVLNLIALIKSTAGPSELFASAAPDSIGLWGHSMGGNIAMRVLTVSSDIKATVLYASLSGDESKNAQLLFNASPDPTFQTELTASPAFIERISPMHYYSNITSPIQLHHGTADQTVPLAWAEETCNAMTAAGVEIECIYYPEEDHTFRRRVADQFWGAMMNFYKIHLSP
ncbi:MAG: alpha/beta fold hydrolase [Chloroflexi bacterium]|nr:MAG: alpha/beta fold hydrolase [Chloroflexota bacterium]